MGVVHDFTQQAKDDLVKDIENAQAAHEEWGGLSNLEWLTPQEYLNENLTTIGYEKENDLWLQKEIEWDAWNFAKQIDPETDILPDKVRKLLNPSYFGSWDLK